MLKQYTKQRKINQPLVKLTVIALLLYGANVCALDADKDEDFLLEGDNFKNMPEVINGETKTKWWGNVVVQQGSLKIKSSEAVVYNGKDGVSKVILTGRPVKMEKIIDKEFGKINVTAKKIDYMLLKDMLLMTGDVIIKSKVQGEMSGEKITMNLKTKEIRGEKSSNKRVKLVIKAKSTTKSK